MSPIVELPLPLGKWNLSFPFEFIINLVLLKSLASLLVSTLNQLIVIVLRRDTFNVPNVADIMPQALYYHPTFDMNTIWDISAVPAVIFRATRSKRLNYMYTDALLDKSC